MRIDRSCRLRVPLRLQAGAQATVQPRFGESNRLPGAAVVPGRNPDPPTRTGRGNRVGRDDDSPSVGRLTGDTTASGAIELRRCSRRAGGVGGRRGHSPPASPEQRPPGRRGRGTQSWGEAVTSPDGKLRRPIALRTDRPGQWRGNYLDAITGCGRVGGPPSRRSCRPYEVQHRLSV